MTTQMTNFDLQTSSIEDVKTLAKYMASSDSLVPAHLRGNPYKCMAIVFLAKRWDLDPWTVAQKTHEIQGILGYEAQLVNAVVSKSQAIKGRFHYEFMGDRKDWKPQLVRTAGRNGGDKWTPKFSENAAVRVGAIIAGEDDITWGEWIYPCDQKVFNSPLWSTNPKQQAGYLAVKFWARWYVPEAILGANTEDELQQRAERDITPEPDQIRRSPLQAALTKQQPNVIDNEILQETAKNDQKPKEKVKAGPTQQQQEKMQQESIEDVLSDDEKAAILAAEREFANE